MCLASLLLDGQRSEPEKFEKWLKATVSWPIDYLPLNALCPIHTDSNLPPPSTISPNSHKVHRWHSRAVLDRNSSYFLPVELVPIIAPATHETDELGYVFVHVKTRTVKLEVTGALRTQISGKNKQAGVEGRLVGVSHWMEEKD